MLWESGSGQGSMHNMFWNGSDVKTWQTQVYKLTQGKTAGSHGGHQETGLQADARATVVGSSVWSVCQGRAKNLAGWAGGSRQIESSGQGQGKEVSEAGWVPVGFPLVWEKPWRSFSKGGLWCWLTRNHREQAVNLQGREMGTQVFWKLVSELG